MAARLGWSEAPVRAAREELMRADLIAFQAPLYQVLSLDRAIPTASVGEAALPPPSPKARAAGELRSLRAILREVTP